MKLTRKQLRQIILEETTPSAGEATASAFGMSERDVYDKIYKKITPLIEEAQKTLQSANDPNLTTLGRILAKVGDLRMILDVYNKDNAALKSKLDVLKSYIDNTSKG